MEIQKSYNNETYIYEIKGQVNWDAAKCKAIKEHIRDYLYIINKGTCFFCKSYIKKGTVDETIEHIASKDNYPIFTFNPYNLTIACHECNRRKNNKETFNLSIKSKEELKKLTWDQYPLEKEDYISVHPYIDKYDEYIEFDKLIYVAKDKNEKGKNTIDLYGLYRSNLVENNSKINETGYPMIDKIFNSEVEVEQYFGYGRLMKYIETKLTTNKKWIEEDIKKLKEISHKDINTFKIFKSLSNVYNKSNETQIKNSGFFKMVNIYAGIVNVENILSLLVNVTKTIEDRRYISTFMDINFKYIEDKYLKNEYLVKNNDGIQIALNFKYLIELVNLYKLDYGLNNISRAIGNDYRVLSDIKEKTVPSIANK